MCPSRWLTATKGTSHALARALAQDRPTNTAPIRPGPAVAATASGRWIPARSSAARTTATIFSVCARAASSGTTPPYSPWMAWV